MGSNLYIKSNISKVKPEKKYDSYVYFIQDKMSNMIKIGKANDVEKRLKQLQTSCPYELELLSYIPGDESLEKDIHKKFSEYRHRGEWFMPKKEIFDYIHLSST